MTLLAERTPAGDTRIIAVGSYFATDTGTAEAAFAVDDRFQGKGLGTDLLERLAVIGRPAWFPAFRGDDAAGQRRDARRLPRIGVRNPIEVRRGGCVEVTLSLDPSADGVVAREERRHAQATAASMRPLLEPRSGRGHRRVARPDEHRPAHSRRDGRGRLQRADLSGQPGRGRSSRACGATRRHATLPRGVDLAVIAVPARRACSASSTTAPRRGVEVAGRDHAPASPRSATKAARCSSELLEQVRGYGMRMVGPNCMGLLNADADVRLNASFSPIFPPPGHVGLSSQSGALGLAILALADRARRRPVDVRQRRQQGGRLGQRSARVLGRGSRRRASSCSTSSRSAIRDASRGWRAASAARSRSSRSRPGAPRAGSRAAGSHTAALAASDVAVDALFHQAGVIRADTIDEMFDVAACLDAQPLPAGTSRRRSSRTPADRAFSRSTPARRPGSRRRRSRRRRAQRLAAFLPRDRERRQSGRHGRVGRSGRVPAGDRGRARRSARPTRSSSSTRRSTSRSRRRPSRAIRDGIARPDAGRRRAKPVLACVMADAGRPQPLDAGGERVPAYAFPENAARALAKVAAYADWRAQPPGLLWSFDDIHADEARAICRGAVEARGDGWLTDEEVRRVLRAFGLPLVASAVAHTAEEAAALRARCSGSRSSPSCARRASQHKTDVGGVRLNLADDAAVRAGVRRHHGARRRGRRARRSRRRADPADDDRRRRDDDRRRRRSAVRAAGRASASAASTSRCSATCASGSRR